MIDYREENYYQYFLILFIVFNFESNSRGRKILTIKKLEALYFIVKNPVVMNHVLELNNFGALANFSESLYDDSLRKSDFQHLDQIGVAIAILCDRGLIKLINTEKEIFVCSNNDLLDHINDSASELLSKNYRKIKKIASLPETKLVKSILDL